MRRKNRVEVLLPLQILRELSVPQEPVNQETFLSTTGESLLRYNAKKGIKPIMGNKEEARAKWPLTLRERLMFLR